MNLDWRVNHTSRPVYRSDHMVQGNFSPILTHGPLSLPLPLASPLALTSPLSFILQRGDQQEGVDLISRREWGKKGKRQAGPKTYKAKLRPPAKVASHLLCTSVCVCVCEVALCVHFTVRVV